jgi:hypothetical protein
VVHEIALFWAVVAAFLVADNLVLLPRGGDVMRFGFNGRLRYPSAARLQVLRRDLIVLNPLDPFDRLVATSRSIGSWSAGEHRTAMRALHRSLTGANMLSMLGIVYLVALAGLAVLSFRMPFGTVLLMLLATHLLAWTIALALLLVARSGLGLSAGRLAGLAAEALFVPAYTVNLGKRVWFRRTLDLPALALGLRELRHAGEDARRDLLAYGLLQRLDAIAEELSAPLSDERHAWIEEARRCLKNSTPSTGS